MEKQSKPISKLQRALLVAAGIFCLVLGTVGLFLPILPTTIFYILAAAAFARNSDKMYQWIMQHRFFGRFIRNYRLYHAVSLTSKIISVAFLWLTLGATVVFAVHVWWLRALLLLIAIGVSWHILALKTLTHEMQAEIDKMDAQRVQPASDILPEA